MILGTRVRAYSHLVREDTTWVTRPLNPPVDGFLTGQRTRNSGFWESEPDEWSGRTSEWYEIRRSFKAYDVTYSLHRKPLVCLPEHIIVREECCDACHEGLATVRQPICDTCHESFYPPRE